MTATVPTRHQSSSAKGSPCQRDPQLMVSPEPPSGTDLLKSWAPKGPHNGFTCSQLLYACNALPRNQAQGQVARRQCTSCTGLPSLLYHTDGFLHSEVCGMSKHKACIWERDVRKVSSSSCYSGQVSLALCLNH